MRSFDVSVENAIYDNDGHARLIKLSNDLLELNVYLNSIDIVQFLRFANQLTNELKAGCSANSPAYWIRENKAVYLLIGEDQEVWDIGVTLNQTVLTEIQKQLKML